MKAWSTSKDTSRAAQSPKNEAVCVDLHSPGEKSGLSQIPNGSCEPQKMKDHHFWVGLVWTTSF